MIHLVLLSLLALGGPAFADDNDLDSSETVTGDPPLSPVSAPKVSEAPPPQDWSAAIKAGAAALKMDVEFVGQCWTGTQLIFKRRYKEGKKYFDEFDKRFPGLGVGHTGAVLIYQSMMMENFDFKWEQPYKAHSDMAIKDLENSLRNSDKNAAWKQFIIGSLEGIESIHLMRKTEYVSALARGVDAMGHIDESRKLAPDFVDPLLGDGLYKYWRTVVTMNSKVLPKGSDQRAEGIAEMQRVERDGVFLAPGATLALAFTYIEERDLKTAQIYCLRNYKLYPDNVVNNMVLARVYMYQRRYDDSLKMLREILADAPDNERAHYYFATVYLRQRKFAEAEASIDRYLAFKLEPYYKAQALHRKGDIYYYRKDYAKAEQYYRQAVDVDDYGPSQVRLDHIADLRKAGKL